MNFNQLIKNDTNDWLVQLLRYIIVGGISFVIDYGLLYLLTEFLGIHYIVSATLSFIAGLIVNYVISINWIFRHSKLSSKSAEFTIYGIIGVVGLLFNNLLLFMFTDILQFHYMISKLMAAAIVLLWNFAGRKIILFKKQ